MARDVTSTFNAWSFTLDENTVDVFEATGNEIPDNSINYYDAFLYLNKNEKTYAYE